MMNPIEKMDSVEEETNAIYSDEVYHELLDNLAEKVTDAIQGLIDEMKAKNEEGKHFYDIEENILDNLYLVKKLKTRKNYSGLFVLPESKQSLETFRLYKETFGLFLKDQLDSLKEEGFLTYATAIFSPLLELNENIGIDLTEKEVRRKLLEIIRERQLIKENGELFDKNLGYYTMAHHLFYFIFCENHLKLEPTLLEERIKSEGLDVAKFILERLDPAYPEENVLQADTLRDLFLNSPLFENTNSKGIQAIRDALINHPLMSAEALFNLIHKKFEKVKSFNFVKAFFRSINRDEEVQALYHGDFDLFDSESRSALINKMKELEQHIQPNANIDSSLT